MKASFLEGERALAKVLMCLDDKAIERAILVVGVDKYEDGKMFFTSAVEGDKSLIILAVKDIAGKMT